nr:MULTISPECIES: DUF2975 domain-containing protein [Streptomyces]
MLAEAEGIADTVLEHRDLPGGVFPLAPDGVTEEERDARRTLAYWGLCLRRPAPVGAGSGCRSFGGHRPELGCRARPGGREGSALYGLRTPRQPLIKAPPRGRPLRASIQKRRPSPWKDCAGLRGVVFWRRLAACRVGVRCGRVRLGSGWCPCRCNWCLRFCPGRRGDRGRRAARVGRADGRGPPPGQESWPPGLVGAVLLLVIFDVLLRLARTFRTGDFFVPANARRLLVIAGLVFLIGTLPPALDVLTTHLLVDGTPVGQAVRTPYSLDTVAVFGALLTAAAAAAFRQGARLREDAEGLV